ncbi:GNAT family N-acetyltransferase, partial [Acidobacteria bacterium AH-259-L09]|nr:GNAT family N-acetyltransferase [Acidobacteria bacterium AH-259-L09]
MQVVSLSEVNCEELEEIFQQEIRCWRDELFWDHHPAVALIKKHMSSRSLSGFAVKAETGVFSGYSYYVINEPMAYIGNIYVRSEDATVEIYAKLLSEILHSLRSKEKVRRIESQIFAFNCDLAPLFHQHGFTATKRYFLSLSLDDFTEGEKPQIRTSGYRLLRWERRFFFPAAEVIYDAYRGSPDHELCHDYQSREGCIRLLRNLVENPGCGSFTCATSYIASDSARRVCAVLVSSKIGPAAGMVAQISVRKDCQRKGLGSLLLRTYFKQAKKFGLKRVSLSVSEENQGALQL